MKIQIKKSALILAFILIFSIYTGDAKAMLYDEDIETPYEPEVPDTVDFFLLNQFIPDKKISFSWEANENASKYGYKISNLTTNETIKHVHTKKPKGYLPASLNISNSLYKLEVYAISSNNKKTNRESTYFFSVDLDNLYNSEDDEKMKKNLKKIIADDPYFRPTSKYKDPKEATIKFDLNARASALSLALP